MPNHELTILKTHRSHFVPEFLDTIAHSDQEHKLDNAVSWLEPLAHLANNHRFLILTLSQLTCSSPANSYFLRDAVLTKNNKVIKIIKLLNLIFIFYKTFCTETKLV